MRNIDAYELIAYVSHELRSPLQPLLAYSHLLRQPLPRKEQKEAVEAMIVAAEYMTRLVGQLLEHARNETAPLTEAERPWVPADLASECIDLIRLAAEHKGLKVALHYSTSAETAQAGHPDLVRQVLLNLLTNAVDFTERGEVGLHCDVAPGEDGCHVLHFTVQDTGPGVDPQVVPRLFEKFYHSNGTGMFGRSRLGLGLAIARAIAQRLGGQLTYAPGEAGGSLFLLSLPTGRVPRR